MRGKVADRDRGDPSTWASLNGLWEWEADDGSGVVPSGRSLASRILVPFPIESCLSGVAPNSSDAYVNASWYRLLVRVAPASPAQRVVLRFGAVSAEARVFIGGRLAATHAGAYDGFEVELTGAISSQLARAPPLRSTGTHAGGATLEILVHAVNNADRGPAPAGKQRISAISNPGGDTYTPNSGIWQSVWVEEVPRSFVRRVELGADLQTLTATAFVDAADDGAAPPTLCYDVFESGGAASGGSSVARACAPAGSATRIAVPSPKPWSPASPYLYDLRVRLMGAQGGAEIVDEVLSYFGMRTFAVGRPPATASALVESAPCSPPPPYTHYPGALGADVPTLLELTNVTLAAAAAACDARAACDGFTLGAKLPVAPTTLLGKVWLKSAPLSIRSANPDWQTYVKRGGAARARPLLNGKPVFLAGWLDQSFWPDGIYTAPTDEALRSDLLAVAEHGLTTARLHQKVNPERWYYHADAAGVLVLQDAVQKYGGATSATIAPFEAMMLAMIRSRGNHPCIVQWTAFNEVDCWRVFNTTNHTVADVVARASAADWQRRPVDTDSGGKANSLPVGSVNDIHTYPYPGLPLPSATRYAMVGEFGGIGAFVAEKEWVPAACHVWYHLNVKTPEDEAKAYVGMAETLRERIADGLAASIYTQASHLQPPPRPSPAPQRAPLDPVTACPPDRRRRARVRRLPQLRSLAQVLRGAARRSRRRQSEARAGRRGDWSVRRCT